MAAEAIGYAREAAAIESMADEKPTKVRARRGAVPCLHSRNPFESAQHTSCAAPTRRNQSGQIPE